MDAIDREALSSDYKGEDETDREALDPKWFTDEPIDNFDDEIYLNMDALGRYLS